MSLTIDLDQHIDSLGLPPEGAALVRHIFAADPARTVRAGTRNVTGRYPSRFGTTRQYESKGELALILEYEQDPDVVAYVDQPDPPLKLDGHLGVQDFFVLGRTAGKWVQVKPEAALMRSSIDRPGYFVFDEPTGRWRCPSGEAFAAKYGLGFEVRSETQINHVLIRNARDLAGTLDGPAPDAALSEAVHALVIADPGIVIGQLVARGADPDALRWLIASRDLYVDLAVHVLADVDHTPVFPDRATAEALAHRHPAAWAVGMRPRLVDLVPGRRLMWGDREWSVVTTENEKVTLLDPDGRIRSVARTDLEGLITSGAIAPVEAEDPMALAYAGACEEWRQAGPKRQQAALLRHEHVREYRRTKLVPGNSKGASKRTIERWERRQREAERQTGHPLVGLLPEPNLGNRTDKVDRKIRQIGDDVIKTLYLTVAKPNTTTTHGDIALRCELEGLKGFEPTDRTVRAWIKQLNPYEVERARAGRKAAYRLQPYVVRDPDSEPVDGDRSWAVGHIDHTRLDYETPLGRPWVSAYRDPFDDRTLARVVSFAGPSAATDLRLMRRCAERHYRLTEVVVLDQGSEGKSVDFQQLCALYEVEARYRPKSAARFGANLERNFGTCNTQVLYATLGNTQATKNVRQLTPEVDPRRHALLLLQDLDDLFNRYDEVVENQVRAPSGMSTRQRYAASMALHGQRPHRIITDLEAFYFDSMPSVDRGGTRVVHAAAGVNVGGNDYQHERFEHGEIVGAKVPVRYDPDDISHVFVFVEGEWVEAVCQVLVGLRVASRRELAFESDIRAELRRADLRGRTGRRVEIATVNAKTREVVAVRLEQQRLEVDRANEAAHRPVPAAPRPESSSVGAAGRFAPYEPAPSEAFWPSVG